MRNKFDRTFIHIGKDSTLNTMPIHKSRFTKSNDALSKFNTSGTLKSLLTVFTRQITIFNVLLATVST